MRWMRDGEGNLVAGHGPRATLAFTNGGEYVTVSLFWLDDDGGAAEFIEQVRRADYTRGGLFRYVAESLTEKSGMSYPVDQSDEAKALYDTALRTAQQNYAGRKRSALNIDDYLEQESHMQDATLNMAAAAFERGGKIVASTQTLKVCRRMASKLVRKYLPPEHHALLDTKFGEILVDLLTPTVVHALASRKMLPASEFLEPAAAYAFEGGVIRHGLELTDMMGDLMESVQGELGELIALGQQFAKAASASTPAEAPLLAESFDAEEAVVGLKVAEPVRSARG